MEIDRKNQSKIDQQLEAKKSAAFGGAPRGPMLRTRPIPPPWILFCVQFLPIFDWRCVPIFGYFLMYFLCDFLCFFLGPWPWGPFCGVPAGRQPPREGLLFTGAAYHYEMWKLTLNAKTNPIIPASDPKHAQKTKKLIIVHYGFFVAAREPRHEFGLEKRVRLHKFMLIFEPPRPILWTFLTFWKIQTIPPRFSSNVGSGRNSDVWKASQKIIGRISKIIQDDTFRDDFNFFAKFLSGRWKLTLNAKTNPMTDATTTCLSGSPILPICSTWENPISDEMLMLSLKKPILAMRMPHSTFK